MYPTLNRVQAPSTADIPALQLPEPIAHTIGKAKLPLFSFASQDYNVTTLDIFWRCGEWYGRQGIPYMMGKMLTKGTAKHTAVEIAHALEQYGAHCHIYTEKEALHIQLTAVADYFESLLPILAEVLQTPSFPQDSLAIEQRIAEKKVAQKEANPSYLAQKALRKLIFGTDHPYGYMPKEGDSKHITRAKLEDYYETYKWHGAMMVMSGAINQQKIEAVREHFEGVPSRNIIVPTHQVIQGAASETLYHPSSLQATIAMGHATITQSHSDYPYLFAVNTLLGGFFGSRLMQTIREEKGYTYGVYARILPWAHSGYWYMATNVHKQVAAETIEAMKAEVVKLQTTLVEEDELRMLQNYLTGHILNLFDSPFTLSERFAHAYLHGIDLSYYSKLYQAIRQITPKKIQAIARTYFQLDKLHVVQVLPTVASK